MTWCRRKLAEPDCSVCPLKWQVQVPPEGDDTARIALVGEGPGKYEVQSGRPFIGDSGQMLSWLLERAGLPPRERLWISNAALCKPTWVEVDANEGIYKTEQQTKEESTQVHCRPRLLAELDIVRPRVVLAVGAQALQALTGAKGILKYHGALFETHFGVGAERRRSYIMGSFHPAHLLRGETRKIQAVVDVYKKAKRLAAGEIQPAGEFLLVSPFNPRGVDRVLDDLDAAVDAVVRRGSDIAVDVEATSEKAVNTTLTVFGFGSAELNLGVAVNILAWDRAQQTYVVCWTPAQWRRIYAAIARLLRSRLTKWFWNLNFDVTVLTRHWPMMVGPYADGIHWHWLMQPDLPHNLGFSCQQFLDVRAWKAGFWQKQEAGDGTNRDLIIYNAEDSLNTAKVIPHLKAAVYARNNGHLVQHQLDVAELARKAYVHGIPCDRQVLAAKRAECERERDVRLNVVREAVRGHEQDLNEYVHSRRCRKARESAERRGKPFKEPKREVIEARNFNVNSPLQMTWLLYRHFGLQVEQRTPGGDPRTSYKAVLEFIKGHPASDIFKAYLEYSEYEAPLRKFNEFEAAIDSGTGRIHPPWNVTGQAGTRWKSSEPNMQNLTKIMKKCLAAEPGWCWVGADAAQLEKRISAALAGCKPLLRVFNLPAFDERAEEWKKYDPAWDAHSLLCALTFGEGYTQAPLEVKKKLRTMAKRVNYGMDYGAFPSKIQTTILYDRRVTSDLRAELAGADGLARIQTLFDAVHSYYPEIDRWAAAEIAHVRLKGYQLIPPLNRRRYWPVRDIEEPKLRNTPIQLAAGDIVNLLFLKMDRAIVAAGLRATMVIHGHDACYWYTWRPHAERVRQIVTENFDTWLAGPAGPVHITGFASIGDSPADVA